MRYALLIMTFISIGLISASCATKPSTTYADSTEQVIFLDAGSTVISSFGETIIETDSVVIPEGKHAYLLRCQDYVEQREGVLP